MNQPIKFVTCPECGNEQADMGRNVACEECGAGPMPTAPSVREAFEKGPVSTRKRSPGFGTGRRIR